LSVRSGHRYVVGANCALIAQKWLEIGSAEMVVKCAMACPEELRSIREEENGLGVLAVAPASTVVD
jgi:hypothetical protein